MGSWKLDIKIFLYYYKHCEMKEYKFLFPGEYVDAALAEESWIKFRPLCNRDFEKGFCDVLKELTSCDTDEENFGEIWWKMYEINQIAPQYLIVVWEDIDSGGIVACGSIIIENKFIHDWHSVWHIEDIVVSKEYNGRWLWKHLIKLLVELWKRQSCYKVILDCTGDVLPFYQWCWFETKNLWLAIYF